MPELTYRVAILKIYVALTTELLFRFKRRKLQSFDISGVEVMFAWPSFLFYQ